jgi:hypothetical protein
VGREGKERQSRLALFVVPADLDFSPDWQLGVRQSELYCRLCPRREGGRNAKRYATSLISTVSPKTEGIPSRRIDTAIVIGQRKYRRRSRRIKPCAAWRVHLMESNVNGLSSTKLEPAANAAALSPLFPLIAKATAVRFCEAGRRISRKMVTASMPAARSGLSRPQSEASYASPSRIRTVTSAYREVIDCSRVSAVRKL